MYSTDIVSVNNGGNYRSNYCTDKNRKSHIGVLDLGGSFPSTGILNDLKDEQQLFQTTLRML